MDRFAAVINGVTWKSDFRSDGKTTGRLAADIIRSVIETMPGNTSLKGSPEGVNERFSRMCGEYPYLNKQSGQWHAGTLCDILRLLP